MHLRTCIVALLLLLSAVLPASAESLGIVQVSGNAYLDGAPEHSGIQVFFQALSPSAITNSALTDSSGHFAAALEVGIYDVVYSKGGYVPQQIEGGLYVTSDTTLADVTLEAGTPMIISGSIGGELDANTLYLVTGNLVVESGVTLRINEGASLRFTGPYSLEVSGRLLSQGTPDNTITFTSTKALAHAGDWGGIRFNSTAGANSIIENCRIQFATNGVSCSTVSPTIANSLIQNCTRGVVCDSSSTVSITDTEFRNNFEGILAEEGAVPIISGCTLTMGSVGITCNGTAPVVTGCELSNNGRAGAVCIESAAQFIGCVFDGNGTGLECILSTPSLIRCTVFSNSIGALCAQLSNLVVSTSIVRSNGTGLFCVDSRISTISYSDFFDNVTDFSGPTSGFPLGVGEMVTTNVRGDSSDTYRNIFIDPKQDLGSGTLALLSDSPCIDAGDPLLPPDVDGTTADMGAVPFVQTVVPPVADFTGAPLSGVMPLEVAFTSLSTGTITSHQWNFGDGKISFLRDPTHEYATPGSYTVTLTVNGPFASDQKVAIDYVTVLPDTGAPTVNFVANPREGYAPLEVAFTNMTTGAVDSVRWYFGDGDSSDAYSPTHTYADPDTFSVRLVAWGPLGTDELTKTDYIKAQAPPPVLADFVASPQVGVAPMTVSFTDLSLGLVQAWDWDFGDGNTSTLQNPINMYNDPGVYTVSLTVTDQVAREDTETKVNYVRVYQDVPTITAVADVPADQGGKVEVQWLGSAFDGPLGATIASYNVWQRYDGEWAGVGSIAATQDSIYRFIAITVHDSSSTGNNYTTFRISAHGVDPTTVLYSAPDSGYSVDNIAPSSPSSVTALSGPGGVVVKWNAVGDPDLRFYMVYSDTISGFTPSPATFRANAVSSPWVDTDPISANRVYYRVSAVDLNGNESDFSPEVVITITGLDGDVPRAQYLSQNVPNPFHSSTVIPFGLSEPSSVTLSVYDVAGRRVYADSRTFGAGHHSFSWSGRVTGGERLSSGVYFYRMDARPLSGNPAFRQQKKLLLVK